MSHKYQLMRYCKPPSLEPFGGLTRENASIKYVNKQGRKKYASVWQQIRTIWQTIRLSHRSPLSTVCFFSPLDAFFHLKFGFIFQPIDKLLALYAQSGVFTCFLELEKKVHLMCYVSIKGESTIISKSI